MVFYVFMYFMLLIILFIILKYNTVMGIIIIIGIINEYNYL